MIIRALDGDHDWLLGKGKQDYLTDNNAIAENVQTRLLSFLNDCFFDLGAGIDWFRFMRNKNSQKELVLACQASILASFGVVRVNKVDAVFTTRRDIQLTYNIDTIFTKGFIQTLGVSGGQ